MILGIGIDSVEIQRFKEWHAFTQKSLQRIFSEEEISYCLSNKAKSAERFAIRFAAREALFKTLSSAYPTFELPFLTLCRLVRTEKNHRGAPCLQVDWSRCLPLATQTYPICHTSWTHTATTATAIVVLEEA
ncbi:MAG: 4'-phosphopantetheinyl transferase superfamily protein [Candidatus Dependentiae bacterium]|nr:4'-phosphopantetheinyl transferase superfamily protein [Candidatus Dependentiae bacterium]